MHKTKPNLTHLRIWGCQCFVIIPPELCSKGSPRCFEAIFVGYEDDRVGWHVRDLNGKYHFSRDVIFNELVPGHLSHTNTPSSSSTIPPSSTLPSSSSSTSSSSSLSTTIPSLPTPRPIRNVQRTVKGQVFAETIHLHDARLAAKPGNAPHPQQSLSAISDFVALLAADEILSLEPAIDIAFFEDNALANYCLLTSVDRYRYQRPVSFNLHKPPNTYREAMACPNSKTWLATMRHE